MTRPRRIRRFHCAQFTTRERQTTRAATKAVANLAADADLAAELKAQAAASKHLGELSLKRICAIESQCSLEFAYSKPAYKGFFQMGEVACKDLGIAIADIDEKTDGKRAAKRGEGFSMSTGAG